MPVKFGLRKLNDESAQQVHSNVLASEERLEGIIQAPLDILALDGLFQIGGQFITAASINARPARLIVSSTTESRSGVEHGT
jgi:hypothetical protein